MSRPPTSGLAPLEEGLSAQRLDPRRLPLDPRHLPNRPPIRFDEHGNPLDERGRPLPPFPHHQRNPETQSVDSEGRPVDSFGLPLSYHPQQPPPHDWRLRGPPPPSPGQNPIPVDQLGRFVHPEELARLQQGRQPPQRPGGDVPVDQFGRPLIPRQFVDQFGRPIPPELLRRLQQRPEDITRPPPPYPHPPMGERKRLEPQEKGEAPSTQRFHQPEQGDRLLPEENPLAQVPLRMIRGEHRPIEEEIANRILSDISEEGSLAGSLASLEELEPFLQDYRYQHRHFDRSESSTPRLEDNLSEASLESSPTLSPKTVKESENFTLTSPPGPLSPPAAVSPTPEERQEEVIKTSSEPESIIHVVIPKEEEEPSQPVQSASSKSFEPLQIEIEQQRQEPVKESGTNDLQKKSVEEPTKIPESSKETLPSEPNNNLLKTQTEKMDLTMEQPLHSPEELKKYHTEMLREVDADPAIPVGTPIFIEPLERHTHPFLISPSLQVDIPLVKDGTLSPISPATQKTRGRQPRRQTPGGTGTKSPIMVSPGREHSMEVLIATKRGKPEFIAPGEEVPELDDKERKTREQETKAKPSMHRPEDDFQDKKPELEEINRRIEQRRKKLDDLDKYRPGNFYKEDDHLHLNEYDIDDSPWDSHYQIGPDTYLMASRGASFNSRVRDYRRELWGDGAPLVHQGYLGYRNRDITVRERRRYTDILRESQHNVAPKSAEAATSQSKDPKANAITRIKADIEKVAPAATKKNQDGTFAPIFASRLHDTYLVPNSPSAIFECHILASPDAEVTWTKHGKVLTEDGKHKLYKEAGSYRLTVLEPSIYDLGEYECHAKNQYGSDKCQCRLISGEAPGRPGRPSLELSSDTELLMTFEPPEGPTYLEGITYRVECRLAGENDYNAPWVVVSDKVEDESVVINHLEPLGIYQFRVIASNGFGWGEPSLHSRIVRTHPRGSPRLQLEELSRTTRFETLSLPGAKKHRHKKHHPYDGLYSNLPAAAGPKSLEGISEESEETEEEAVAETSKGALKGEVQLVQGEITGRFELGSMLFSTKRSILRNANDNENESSPRCVAKLRYCPSGDDALKEYETLRAGQHENVVRLLAASLSGDMLHLFEERLYEDVFARFCFNDNYTEEQVAIVARQLSSALHWLHFKGLAHLDVNPHNVMFISKRAWILRLCDFSSAQFIGADAKKPSEPEVQWAPPEFYVEETPVTVQSDIWGLGVIVFCLLGGFHPFSSEFDTPEEVKENVINQKCDPNLIPVSASQDSLSFVTWALKKSPLRRMRTDEALSHRFLSSEPSAVRRREAIRYSSNRLRKTAQLTKQGFEKPVSSQLQQKYGNN